MTTNAPDDLTNNQTPLSDLPWQSKTSNVVEPLNMGLPVSNLPTTNNPPVIPSADGPIAVPVELPVVPPVATPITAPVVTPVTNPVATPVDMPIPVNPVTVQNNVVQPIVEPIVQATQESKELPGKVLPMSPLTEKITPIVSTPIQTVVPELKKDTTLADPIAENKKRVKNIIMIVVGLVAGLAVLLLGIYFASNAS